MSILDNAKEVARVAHEINNLELYQRVLNLHSDIISLVEENNRLRDGNKELAGVVALKKQMTFKVPFYYQEGDATPFCPACWETKQQAIHLLYSHDAEDYTRWDCPTCRQMFLDHKGAKRKVNTRAEDLSDPQGWMR